MDDWTTLRVLEWTTGKFGREGIEPARLEAQVLLAHVLQCDRVSLYVMHDKPLAPAELAAYRDLIRRRLSGEPVAYLVGEQEFWSLPFAVDDRVLIPRHDTETLIEVVLDRVADRSAPLRIADVGTGSGAIAVTLARELPNARVVATDISEAALELARANAERNRVSDRIELRRGDLLAPLGSQGSPGPKQFDVLAANLPYIPSGDIEALSAEVRREPRGALDGGADGLDLMRRLIRGAPEHIVAGGHLVLEHGFDQAGAVAELIGATGAFARAATRADLANRPRITAASRR